MYESITIQNFRCFPHIEIKGFRRLNLVTGKNNVGKTALLEALFLSGGPFNPDLLEVVNGMRGLVGLPPVASELWGWVFHDKEVGQQIQLKVGLRSGQESSLTIRLSEAPYAEPLPIQGAARQSTTQDARPNEPNRLNLEYTSPNGERFVSHATILSSGKIERVRASVPDLPSVIFFRGDPRDSAGDVARFSQIKQRKEQDRLLQPLKNIEPRLRDLAVLVIGQPIIAADIGKPLLIPLPLAGDGLVRLLSILTAIVEYKLVLIDEIDNGFHHSVLPDVWRAIADAARNADAQVFATTHSFECIQAAYESFRESEILNDFRLLRLEERKGEVVAVTYENDSFETSMEMNFEVR